MTKYNVVTDTPLGVLVNLADCAYPDSWEPEGAEFLTRTRDALVEAVTYAQNHGDEFNPDDAHEVADNAPSVYTYQKWQQFVALGAWTEDVTDLTTGESMDESASVALYLIAERLCAALLDDWEVDESPMFEVVAETVVEVEA